MSLSILFYKQTQVRKAEYVYIYIFSIHRNQYIQVGFTDYMIAFLPAYRFDSA